MAASLRKVTVATTATTVVPASSVITTGSRNVRLVNRSQIPVTLGNGDILSAGDEQTFSLAYTSTFTCTAPVSTSIEVYDDYPIVGAQVTAAAATDIDREVWVSGEAYPRARWLADGTLYQGDGTTDPGILGNLGAVIGAPSELLATGQAVPQRWGTLAGSTLTMVSGTMFFTYFKCKRSATVTTGLYSTGTTAVATPTRIRYGLYSVAASDGALTLVASTADGTTGLSAANTRYPLDYSTPVVIAAGTTYASGILVVAGTLPSLVYMGTAGVSGTAAATNALAPRLTGQLAGQTDLPASVAGGSVASTSGYAYCEIY